MQLIERKRGAFHDLVFYVDLANYVKTFADIDDVIFSVKVKKTDDDDSIFIKKKSLSQITITDEGEVKVEVTWGATEYDKFIIDKEYLAGLFLKFTGDPVADENVDQIFKLKITQDYLIDE